MDHVASLLSRLATLVPMQLWMVTRTRGNHWIVLQSHDRGYGISSGDVFNWCDSFCSRMVQGHGPSIAAKASEVPAYVAAPIGQQVEIGSYIGVPLLRRDHSLFGTLCAIDPDPKSPALRDELPLVQDFAGAISALLRLAELDERESRASLMHGQAMRRDLLGFYDVLAMRESIPALQSRMTPLGIGARVLCVELSLDRDPAPGSAESWALEITAPILLRDWVEKRDGIAGLWTHHTFLAINFEHNVERVDAEIEQLSRSLANTGVQSRIRWTRVDGHRSLQEALLACMRPRESDLCRTLDSATH